MYTWGDKNLIVRRGSYDPPFSVLSVNEITVIPKPGDTKPTTVIQTGGRTRGRARFTIFLKTAEEYSALYTDYINSTVRTFTDRDGLTIECFISALSAPEISRDDFRQCNVELIEV